VAPQKFLGAQLAIVIEAHGLAVGAGILDDMRRSPSDYFRQLPSELANLSLFSQSEPTTSTVSRAGPFLLAQHLDMMIGAVQGRPHESGHAGIDADVGAVDLLAVDGPGDEHAMRTGHVAAALHEQGRTVPLALLQMRQRAR
jgi:hypothetical protein